jgi:hypothetical protein
MTRGGTTDDIGEDKLVVAYDSKGENHAEQAKPKAGMLLTMEGVTRR